MFTELAFVVTGFHSEDTPELWSKKENPGSALEPVQAEMHNPINSSDYPYTFTS